MSHFPQEIIAVVGRCAAPLPARPAVGAPGGGACPAGRRLTVPFRNPQGGLPFGLPAAPDFSLLFCPHPPSPPSRREGGDYKFILPGASPPAPLHLTACDTYSSCHAGARRGACPRRRQFGAKPIESPFHGQCRQPRRGGTGGDGTIRRKRRRRLRWSSPPGQGEQVPPGACLLDYPPPLTLVCFFAPIPPAPFPSGEGGAQGYFMQGAPPLASPGAEPSAAREKRGEPCTRRRHGGC